MISTFVLVALLGLQAAAQKPVSLPDTPQGRHVDAYIKAFNSGDEKAFLAANEKLMVPELLARRPPRSARGSSNACAATSAR